MQKLFKVLSGCRRTIELSAVHIVEIEKISVYIQNDRSFFPITGDLNLIVGVIGKEREVFF